MICFIDEVTWISKNLIKQDRSRISIIKKLKQLDIIIYKVKIFLKLLDI
jgi:hypothetical protein